MCTCMKEMSRSCFRKKKVNKSQPKRFVTGVISHLVNPGFSFPSYQKTTFFSFLFFLAQYVPFRSSVAFFFFLMLSKHLKRKTILVVEQGQHLFIQFRTTRRLIHVTWTQSCDLSLKQHRPPADSLDQTVRPFRVKKIASMCTVNPNWSHDPPAGLISVKGTCALFTDRRGCCERCRAGRGSFTGSPATLFKPECSFHAAETTIMRFDFKARRFFRI